MASIPLFNAESLEDSCGGSNHKDHTMPSNDPEYQKRYIRQHYLENKEYYKAKAKTRNKKVKTELRKFVDRYKLYVGCVDCGYKENALALQLDHVRGEKIMAVSTLVSRATSLEKVKEEIRKCEVRCANCHSIVTHERRSKNELREGHATEISSASLYG